MRTIATGLEVSETKYLSKITGRAVKSDKYVKNAEEPRTETIKFAFV